MRICGTLKSWKSDPCILTQEFPSHASQAIDQCLLKLRHLCYYNYLESNCRFEIQLSSNWQLASTNNKHSERAKLQAWGPSRRSRRSISSIASIIHHLVKREGEFWRQHSAGDLPPRGWTRGSVLLDYIAERHVEPFCLVSWHADGRDLLRRDLIQRLVRHTSCHISSVVTPPLSW